MSKLPSTSCRERTPLRSEKDPQAKLLHRRLLRSLALGSLKLLATGTPSCVARLTALCTAIWAATASRTSVHGAIDLPTTTTTAAACATPFFKAPLSLSSRTINARIMASSSLCCLAFLGLRRWALFFLRAYQRVPQGRLRFGARRLCQLGIDLPGRQTWEQG